MNSPGTFKRDSLLVLTTIAILLSLSCGTPGTGRNTDSPDSPDPVYTHSVGGVVSGLVGTLTLANNGSASLTLSANGPFTMSTGLARGTAYDIAVSSQPSGQTCTIVNGSGSIGSVNVTNVQVTCADNRYTIGGTVSDLLSGTLVLQNNGGDDLNVTTNGSFAFNTALTDGRAYSVTIRTHPAQHLCTVANGSGTVNASNVEDVQITCVEDAVAATADVLFPPAMSMTDGETVTVRGTASDNYTITAVRVNGVNAQTNDGYQHWEAIVPLTMGSNTLTVETEDSASNVDPQAAEVVVKREEYFRYNENIVLDTANRRALIGDTFFRDAIVAVDLQTGVRSVLSDSTTPNDVNPFWLITDMAMDSANNRLLVTDDNRHSAIVAVDLQTGNRTIFSDSVTPTLDNPFSDPGSISIDGVNNRALVTDLTKKAVIAVDLSTGARTILSDNTTPNGLNPFTGPVDIAVDGAHGRALVLDPDRLAIIAVDLLTGARSILSDNTEPNANNPFSGPMDIVIDDANNRALVTDAGAQTVFAVDLATGGRTIVSNNTTTNSTDLFRIPKGIVVDSENNRALIADTGRNMVFAVDLSSGARTILLEDTFPDNANPFVAPLRVAMDRTNNRFLVVDDMLEAIVAVDPGSGARTIFSDNSTPNAINPFINIGEGLVIDGANNRALVTDAGRSAVVAVDLATGARSILYGNSAPFSPFVPSGIAIDSLNNRALVVDAVNKRVTGVDLVTGTSSILSDNTTPDTGNPFVQPRNIAIDAANSRALVSDQTKNALIALDLSTGARTILSDGFSNLFGDITVDSARNHALVMDGSYGAVIAVDLSTGARTTVTGDTTPNAYNVIELPGGIAFDDIRNRILATDGAVVGALFAIDPETGERVVLSK